MAVVTFQRPGDALAAQAKYDGKIVDGREFALTFVWTVHLFNGYCHCQAVQLRLKLSRMVYHRLSLEPLCLHRHF